MNAGMRIVCAATLALLLTACAAGTQRGMQGAAYVSTARPGISMQAKELPLLAGGEGSCSLTWAGGLSGTPVRVWLAAYGKGRPAEPLAVVAQADLLSGWYWDGDSSKPFSVDKGVEVLGDVGFQACTYIVESGRDPFAVLAGVQEDAAPVRWIARSFAARCNFNESKLVLEYREPLPEHLAAAPHIAIGQTDWLRAFEQRARDAFVVGPAPANREGIARAYAAGVRWRYLDQRFLGTVSRYEPIARY
ncbi:MAG: DUF4851 domain-containing protein [Desulfovibrio desulfuricans]|nr:DUF4851 domain-containing protein [Desulfovibrio desulfuricans]